MVEEVSGTDNVGKMAWTGWYSGEDWYDNGRMAAEKFS